MLREDKTARIELIKGQKRRPWSTPEPDRYEFSVGKYTRSGNLAKTYHNLFLSPGEERFFDLQLTQPVYFKGPEGTQWWWYLNRFWKDDENLDAADVQALVLQRERQKEAKLERARAGVLGIESSGADTTLGRDRLLKQEERERKQRLLEERLAEVEGRKASLEATISALENLLSEALDRDSTVALDSDDGDVVSYLSSVLDGSPYPEGFPKKHRVAFVPESRQLVVEYELPTLTIVPAVKAYKYVASRGAIDETPRPAAQLRALYSQVVAQTALRTSMSFSRRIVTLAWKRLSSTAWWTRSTRQRGNRHGPA